MGPTTGEYDPNRGPHSPDELIAALAGRQHGVVSLLQLRAVGVSDDEVKARLRTRRLFRLHRGVYAVGHEALSYDGRLLAAVLACGPDALASHLAAAGLHGLLRSGLIEVTAPRGRKPKPGIELHRSRVIHEEDRTTVRGIPVTSAARTLVDLADALSDERLATAVDRSEVLRVFDLRAVERAQARVPGRTGRHRMRRVLAAYRPEPRFLRSEAERRLAALCERHGLPRPQCNVWVAGHELDAYWPAERVALEVDGAATHHTRQAFHRDRRRDRALAAEGIQSLRVTWPDLDGRLMAQLREILRRR